MMQVPNVGISDEQPVFTFTMNYILLCCSSIMWHQSLCIQSHDYRGRVLCLNLYNNVITMIHGNWHLASKFGKKLWMSVPAGNGRPGWARQLKPTFRQLLKHGNKHPMDANVLKFPKGSLGIICLCEFPWYLDIHLYCWYTSVQVKQQTPFLSAEFNPSTLSLFYLFHCFCSNIPEIWDVFAHSSVRMDCWLIACC